MWCAHPSVVDQPLLRLQAQFYPMWLMKVGCLCSHQEYEALKIKVDAAGQVRFVTPFGIRRVVHEVNGESYRILAQRRLSFGEALSVCTKHKGPWQIPTVCYDNMRKAMCRNAKTDVPPRFQIVHFAPLVPCLHDSI
eukprot:1196120-Prorocentrum_minimum.AAC.4